MQAPQPPEKPASQTMTDAKLIEVHNKLLTMASNFLNDATLEDLKQELIKRDVITADHEGSIDT